MKYLASFHTTLKVSRYLFRALAVLLWLLIAFVSVFYIVNALHEREAEIHQELNLNADQAQRFIQRTAALCSNCPSSSPEGPAPIIATCVFIGMSHSCKVNYLYNFCLIKVLFCIFDKSVGKKKG